jgi:hypothetical protein
VCFGAWLPPPLLVEKGVVAPVSFGLSCFGFFFSLFLFCSSIAQRHPGPRSRPRRPGIALSAPVRPAQRQTPRFLLRFRQTNESVDMQ